MILRLMPLGLAIALAIPALGEPSASFDSGRTDVRHGLAATPTPIAPVAQRAPASREKTRDGLPESLKATEELVNEARHLNQIECLNQIGVILKAEGLFQKKFKNNPNRASEATIIKDLIHQTKDVGAVMETQTGSLNQLDSWLDSITSGAGIPQDEISLSKRTLPKVAQLIFLNEEGFIETPKDPADTNLNNHVKALFINLKDIAKQLSNEDPENAQVWSDAAGQISADSFLKEISLLKKTESNIEQANSSLVDYIQKTGLIRSEK